MLVCGETRIPAADGGTNEDGTSCWPEETWEEARALCTGAGARLCTVEELQGDETRGTGCMADGWLNWSSDDIGCSAGEHVLVVGSMTASNGAYADQEPRCRDNAEEAGVRCCADVTVGTPCDVATAENLDQLPGVIVTLGTTVDTVTDEPVTGGDRCASQGCGFRGGDSNTIIDMSHEPAEWTTSPFGDSPDCSTRLFVTIDLGANYPVDGVTLWHYHGTKF